VLGAVLLSLGVAFLILGVVLPEYRAPQTFTASGPNVAFNSERDYRIDFYLIPPIDKGQPIVREESPNNPSFLPSPTS
jgi:hypothetical protein